MSPRPGSDTKFQPNDDEGLGRKVHADIEAFT
jgi:hypothetical protein